MSKQAICFSILLVTVALANSSPARRLRRGHRSTPSPHVIESDIEKVNFTIISLFD